MDSTPSHKRSIEQTAGSNATQPSEKKRRTDSSDDASGVRIVDNFISGDECKALIDFAEKNERFLQSFMFGEEQSSERSSSTGFFARSETALLTKIERAAAELVALPAANVENVQLVRYHARQLYGVHMDTFPDESATLKHEQQFGGQRVFTVLVYLTDVDEDAGGCTHFPALKLRVRPKAGRAVWWSNVLADGSEDFSKRHEGEPPTRGVKYAANVWIRERTFVEEELLANSEPAASAASASGSSSATSGDGSADEKAASAATTGDGNSAAKC